MIGDKKAISGLGRLPCFMFESCELEQADPRGSLNLGACPKMTSILAHYISYPPVLFWSLYYYYSYVKYGYKADP